MSFILISCSSEGQSIFTIRKVVFNPVPVISRLFPGPRLYPA